MGYSIASNELIITLWKVLEFVVLYQTSRLNTPVSKGVPYQEFELVKLDTLIAIVSKEFTYCGVGYDTTILLPIPSFPYSDSPQQFKLPLSSIAQECPCDIDILKNPEPVATN